jgi:serine/threonine protein kinase/tetratricopeptide (TPR) repeat protein
MTLTREQMAQMTRLLDEARTLDEPARLQWLQNLSPAYQGLSESLRAALFAGQDPQHVVASGLTTGAMVGPYELIRLLGAGGMAEVWLAKRADGAFKREVALKLPLVSRLRKDLEQRFARERDILASLEHPNIARLYDAGIDSLGLPYLAMEYVAGEAITVWCDERRLSISGRLQLLIQVLEGIQYAHERRVVHRDLKPSNIMVTDSAQARLLDFGVAKLLEATEGPALTQLHGRAFTPHYASPEQLRGDAIDARSDIYSIGVLLYELLSGSRPYRVKEYASPGVLEQAIVGMDVRRPSTQTAIDAGSARAISSETLIRQLRGDLDAISLKALAKSPDERYSSALEFAEDLRRHLNGQPVTARAGGLPYRTQKWLRRNRAVVAVVATALVAVAALLGYELRRGALSPPPGASAVVFAPPPHSIAVLPFVNMSGDPDQEYFSDGLSEELLNSLSHLNSLQVVARTSSFSFKGKNIDVSTIARRLNVGAVLEGSVRRSGSTVRITVQLINGVNGFHMWSQSYDRDLSDILQVQAEVASSVARQLEVQLSGGEAGKIELGGTRNPQAYEAYLRAAQLLSNWDTGEQGIHAALAAFDQAIALDPNYAWAHVGRSRTLTSISIWVAKPNERDAWRAQASAAAERAVVLAPELGEAHAVLAVTRAYGLLNFVGAAPEYERALALAPGSAYVERVFAAFYSQLGHHEVAVNAARRAVSLDPQNVQMHLLLGQVLSNARHFDQALSAFQDALVLSPDSHYIQAQKFYALLASGQLERAQRLCELPATPLDDDERHECLALAYHALGRQTDADRHMQQLQAMEGNRWAFAYAEIYAQWGNTAAALEWLGKAEQLRDPSFQVLRVSWLLDPIRDQPQFKAIEARLNLPP